MAPVAQFGWWTHTFPDGQIMSQCGFCHRWIVYDSSTGWFHEERPNSDHAAYAGYVVREDRELTDQS